jgi:hypothetical protein
MFTALGDAVVTGPTGHNLRDLRLLLADSESRAAQPELLQKMKIKLPTPQETCGSVNGSIFPATITRLSNLDVCRPAKNSGFRRARAMR